MQFLKDIKELLKLNNNIDKLMTDKVNDYTLIEEQPCAITIGKKIIYVGNFTLENNYKFFNDYSKLMGQIGLKYVNFDHLGNGKELYPLCLKNKKWYKGLLKIIGNTILKQQAYYLNDKKQRILLKWENCSIHYFKKNVSIEKLLQIVMIIYAYNFDAEKKNFKILVNREGLSQLTETYMYSWLLSLPGLTGKFQLALYQKPESLDKEYQSMIEDTQIKNKE
jgi:hypothetical protein